MNVQEIQQQLDLRLPFDDQDQTTDFCARVVIGARREADEVTCFDDSTIAFNRFAFKHVKFLVTFMHMELGFAAWKHLKIVTATTGFFIIGYGQPIGERRILWSVHRERHELITQQVGYGWCAKGQCHGLVLSVSLRSILANIFMSGFAFRTVTRLSLTKAA
jgi:hypothetical protein